MKKLIIFIALFSLLSFGLALPALAEEAAPVAAPTDAATVANPAPAPAPAPAPEAKKPVFKSRQVVLYGDLTAISAKTIPADLTVKLSRVIPEKVRNVSGIYPKKDGSVIVHLTDKTKIVRKYMGRADLSELAVGDKLMVTGKLAEDGSVNAQLVKDNSIQKLFRANKGEVLTIDAAAQTFGMKIGKEDKVKEYKIFVTPNTKFSKWGVEKPSFADLKVGDSVKVQGVIRQAANEITADSVVIQVSKEEIQKVQAEKKKAAALKQLEKSKAQLEKKIKPAPAQ